MTGPGKVASLPRIINRILCRTMEPASIHEKLLKLRTGENSRVSKAMFVENRQKSRHWERCLLLGSDTAISVKRMEERLCATSFSGSKVKQSSWSLDNGTWRVYSYQEQTTL